MKKIILLCFLSFSGICQGVLPPSDFLQYELGSQFTYHADMESYIDHIALNNPRFKKIPYGKSEEGRNLFIVIYGTTENIKKCESIRTNHLKNLHLLKGNSEAEVTLISWYAFNIHGDEAVGTETAMQLLYHLAINAPNENELVIVDPCQNPDGRERYVQRHNGSFYKNAIPLTQQWPKGRFNHYLSDLNRDWVWQVQKESQQRVKLYNSWMPHVFADFHEMEVEKSYFFPPPAEPLHKTISSWQKNLLSQIGAEMETLFKGKKWDYFTEKEFDLLYPSYGDTYSTYNGAIGLTLEQGGGDKAGLNYIKANGDTLTLKSRIEKHFEASKALNKVSANNRFQIIQEQTNFHLNVEKNGEGMFINYIIKNDIPAKTQVLLKTLDDIQIEYHCSNESLELSGYHFQSKTTKSFRIEKGDLLISTKQPKGHLVRVLFEPETFMSDIKTYDISAWSLPYLHNLEAYGCINDLEISSEKLIEVENSLLTEYGFSVIYNSASSVKFIAEALNLNAEIGFSESQKLMIDKENNFIIYEKLLAIAKRLKLEIAPIAKKEYKRLAKNNLEILQKPKIGIFQGEEISETDLGDLIFYLDKYLSIPFTQINSVQLNQLEYKKFDVLIFPNGGYKNISIDYHEIKQWLADGGKLVLIKDALSITEDLNIGQLIKKNIDEIKYSREKDKPSNLVQGVIFKAPLHSESPLRYGLINGYNFLSEHLPEYQSKDSKSGFTSTIGLRNHLSGYIGSHAATYLEDSFVLGTYYFGNGVVYQMANNPLFRGILEDGKVLMGNALFLPKR